MDWVGELVCWVLLWVLVTAEASALRLQATSPFLKRPFLYFPCLFTGALIWVRGPFLANLVSSPVRSDTGSREWLRGDLGGRVVRFGINLTTSTMAREE